jgi:integrase
MPLRAICRRAVAAVPVEDQAVCAAAFLGGLGAGELQALVWDDVDLESRVIVSVGMGPLRGVHRAEESLG